MQIETTSTHAGYTYFTFIKSELSWKHLEIELNDGLSIDASKSNLIKLFEKALSDARKDHRLWAVYRPIQWYIWCAENYPEAGFCPEYAMQLASISVPGNPKGEAVRSSDPDAGPLHRSLELPLLIKAMLDDKSKIYEHLQQKAAVALSIALGRNPANLTYLKEFDLVNLTPNDETPTWIIKMPRIKKRQLNPRDDLMEEFLDKTYANFILELIEANKVISTEIDLNGRVYEIEKPLFINRAGNKAAILSGIKDSTFNMTSEGISKLLQNFVTRHKIISPITNDLLRVSARRFRYTLGTALAAEGVSKKELARILDHTDTQHVLVYFELAGSIVEHLDKASAKGYSQILNLFKGKIIDSLKDAVNGERDDKHLFYIDETLNAEAEDIGVCGKKEVCHLDPPYSCYLCEKFQPYRHANHEYVLECLIAGRDEKLKKYENSRLGIQLDDVIYAVAQVAVMCAKDATNG